MRVGTSTLLTGPTTRAASAARLVDDDPPEQQILFPATEPDFVGSRSNTGRVLVVEEQLLVAVGLQLALAGRGWDVHLICESTAQDVISCAQRLAPRCALLDIHLARGFGSGIELIAPLLASGARVVVLTAERRRMVLAECIEAGAVGWISKCVALDELESALRLVIAGEPILGRADRASLLNDLRLERAGNLRASATFDQLTQREGRVLGALIDGLSAEEIADAHFVALTTVRSQIRSILQKLGVHSQIAAVALATAHRELLPEPAQGAHDRRRTHAGSVRCGGPEYRR